MRVILDANVAIAAAASRGLCESILELCLERHTIILSDGILEEIKEKLTDKLKIPPSIVADFLKLLIDNAEMHVPEEVAPETCRDPDDLMILGLVAPGNAHVMVTGDKDLLVLKYYKQAQIMTPRKFWEANQG